MKKGNIFMYGEGAMMSMTVSKPVFDYLYHHLADIHNRKMKIVAGFALDYDEYMKMLDHLKAYIQQMEHFLNQSDTQGSKNELPFVIYNCIVALRHNNETRRYCATLAGEQAEQSWQVSDVTMLACNSPLAFELLFKRCGDKVEIEKDGEKKKFTVCGIDPNPHIPIIRPEA